MISECQERGRNHAETIKIRYNTGTFAKKIAPAAHRPPEPPTQFGGIGAKPFRQRQGYLHERDRVRPQVHPGSQMSRLVVGLQIGLSWLIAL